MKKVTVQLVMAILLTSLKKKGVNRMQVLFYLFCLVFVLSGCSSQKSVGWQENLLYKDTMTMLLMDASCWKTKIRYTDTVNWKIKEVVYSPPDSLGRQFPGKVTDIQIDKCGKLDGIGEVVKEVKQEYNHGQALHTDVKSLPPQGHNQTALLLAACLIVIGLLFFILQRRRRLFE